MALYPAGFVVLRPEEEAALPILASAGAADAGDRQESGGNDLHNLPALEPDLAAAGFPVSQLVVDGVVHGDAVLGRGLNGHDEYQENDRNTEPEAPHLPGGIHFGLLFHTSSKG